MIEIEEETVNEFLQHSNFIENERREEALEDAQLAWKYAYKKRNNISVKDILEIHKLLMHRLRPDIAGKIRNCDVWIGGECRRFISESLIKSELQNVCQILGNYTEVISLKEIAAKETHVDFEQIHPFEDGNGRVGRILYNIHRLYLDLLIHIIHEGKEQMEYYKWFK